MMPAQIDPQLLLAFLPQLEEYRKDLHLNSHSADNEAAEHLSFLIKFLKADHTATLQKINNFISHAEITFDLLWAIFIPHQIIFTSCKTTSEPRAVRLRTISLRKRIKFMIEEPYWQLCCEYIDENVDFAFPGQQYKLATIELEISHFDGVVKIAELVAYPIRWHPDHKDIRDKLFERGRRWLELTGVHHMHYNGMAYRKSLGESTADKKVKVSLTSNSCVQTDRLTIWNFR
jgi:hypothetical protein